MSILHFKTCEWHTNLRVDLSSWARDPTNDTGCHIIKPNVEREGWVSIEVMLVIVGLAFGQWASSWDHIRSVSREYGGDGKYVLMYATANVLAPYSLSVPTLTPPIYFPPLPKASLRCRTRAFTPRPSPGGRGGGDGRYT